MPQFKALCVHVAMLVLSVSATHAQATAPADKDAKSTGASGKPNVIVRDVKFLQVTLGGQVNKWNRMQVELEAKNNPDPKAFNKRWLDKVKVTVTQIYKTSSPKPEDWNYYRSVATVLTLEVGVPRSLLFYLPGDVVKRDRINKEPDFYFVSLEVAGTEEPIFDAKGALIAEQQRAVSRDISQKEKFEKAKDAADRGVSTNSGILRPQYLITYPDAPVAVPPSPEYIREDTPAR
jgi:hypothetical protein